MKSFIFSIAIASILVVTGCDKAPTLYCHLERGPCTYRVDPGAPAWVRPSVVHALAFWQALGVPVQLDDANGSIPVTVAPIAMMDGWFSEAEQKIVISPLYNAPFDDLTDADLDTFREAVLAHEIGHSIGLPHVRNRKSLMAERPHVNLRDGSLSWSADDARALARVMP